MWKKQRNASLIGEVGKQQPKSITSVLSASKSSNNYLFWAFSSNYNTEITLVTLTPCWNTVVVLHNWRNTEDVAFKFISNGTKLLLHTGYKPIMRQKIIVSLTFEMSEKYVQFSISGIYYTVNIIFSFLMD